MSISLRMEGNNCLCLVFMDIPRYKQQDDNIKVKIFFQGHDPMSKDTFLNNVIHIVTKAAIVALRVLLAM